VSEWVAETPFRESEPRAQMAAGPSDVGPSTTGRGQVANGVSGPVALLLSQEFDDRPREGGRHVVSQTSGIMLVHQAPAAACKSVGRSALDAQITVGLAVRQL
jgi:hypothetical protein